MHAYKMMQQLGQIKNMSERIEFIKNCDLKNLSIGMLYAFKDVKDLDNALEVADAVVEAFKIASGGCVLIDFTADYTFPKDGVFETYIDTLGRCSFFMESDPVTKWIFKQAFAKAGLHAGREYLPGHLLANYTYFYQK
jgi:hypothetical protein